MSQHRSSLYRFFVFTSLALGSIVSVGAQTTPTVAPVPIQLAIAPKAVQKADAYLSTLTPSVTFDKLESGNDLLLQFPDIAVAGPVHIKMTSTIPRTDRLWLLSLSNQTDGPTALLASVQWEPAALPETTMLLDLRQTQSLLMVVRASGKYYGVHRQIKIGQADHSKRKK